MTHEMVPVETAAPRRAPLMAGARPAAIVPQSMEECFRLASAVCAAGMAPRGLETPEKAMVAIMHGLEIGLTPMAALQRIAVVNGRPTIWGDGAVGLVRGSGLCEWIRETLDGVGDAMVASCESQRRNEPEPVRRTFSVADAKKAGLWGKAGPWQQFPTRMLAMRARAFCLRDGFADVLGGLYLKEELDNGEDHQSVQPRRVAPSPSAPQIEVKPETQPAPIVQPEPQPTAAPRRAPSPTAAPEATEKPAEPRQAPSVGSQPAKQESLPAASHYDPEAVRKRFAAAVKAAKDTDELNDAWMSIIDPIYDDALQPDKDDWDRIHKTRFGELAGDSEP